MKVKMILPALMEAESPAWRPVKYSLSPPLGLASLAAHCSTDDDVIVVDQHVESLNLDDEPDLVVIQVYITNAYRAYAIADSYRQRGIYVVHRIWNGRIKSVLPWLLPDHLLLLRR